MEHEKAVIKIIDGAGKEVGYDESNTLSRTLNLKKLQNGSYFVNVINDGKTTNNVKVILQQ